MRIPPRSASNLATIDRIGSRDEHWRDAFSLARLAAEVIGRRCLACGRRLWSGSTGRIYCDETCRKRHGRRRERLRAALREMGEACPFCSADA